MKVFRSRVGKLIYIARHDRPDASFDALELSTLSNSAKISDLKYGERRLKKLDESNNNIRFSQLGSTDSWELWAFADASLNNLPDRVSSTASKVILLVDSNGNACAISWGSAKVKRVVRSSEAAEALSIVEAVEETLYLKAVLVEMLGMSVSNVPVIVFTDNKNTVDGLSSTSLIDDRRLRIDIAQLKQVCENGDVNRVVLVRSDLMLANSLTKRGANSELLLHVLRTGKIQRDRYL